MTDSSLTTNSETNAGVQEALTSSFGTSSSSAAASPELTPEEQAKAEILNDVPEPPPKARVSKFGETAPSEAELMGLDEPEKEEKLEEQTKTEEKKSEESGEEEESKEEPKGKSKKSEDTKSDEPKSDDAKPPKGYVKHEALHEARIINKALNMEIDRLKREVEVLSQIPVEEHVQTPSGLPPGLPPNFKVLTEEEEDALMEEDIVVFNKYQRDLRKYNQFKKAEERESAEHSRIADASRRRMVEIVPDLFDQDSDTNANLTQFASEHGIDPSILSVLTDPSVKIILPGAKKPLSMGPAAVAMVDFLNKVHRKIKSALQNPEISEISSENSGKKPEKAEKSAKSEQELREELTKELTSELTEEITKRITRELMEKLNKNQTSFRSIGDAPAQGDVPGKHSFSESDFRKMSPEQRRKALGG